MGSCPNGPSSRRRSPARASRGSVRQDRPRGPRAKHVEVQIISPAAGRAMGLGVRDCSLQRRHQKLVEETPLARFAELAPAIGQAAVAVADACGYVNAGTVEFLLDADDGRFY